MQREGRSTKVDYDVFWDESVHEGAAYFFRWLGEPRATVLAIWAGEDLVHVEVRKCGDVLPSAAQAEPIAAHIVRAFSRSGFCTAGVRCVP